jgi:hypothetical protein
VVANLPPVDTAPVAVRARQLLDGTLLSVARSSKTRANRLGLALLSDIVLVAMAVWSRSRSDRRLGGSSWGSWSRSSRAPPPAYQPT